MIELKPCPFCGHEAVLVRPGTRRQSCIVQCGYCGCKLEGPDEEGRSGSAWNTRAADDGGVALYHDRARRHEADAARLAAAQELLLRIEAHKLPHRDASGVYWSLPMPLIHEIEAFRSAAPAHRFAHGPDNVPLSGLCTRCGLDPDAKVHTP